MIRLFYYHISTNLTEKTFKLFVVFKGGLTSKINNITNMTSFSDECFWKANNMLIVSLKIAKNELKYFKFLNIQSLFQRIKKLLESKNIICNVANLQTTRVVFSKLIKDTEKEISLNWCKQTKTIIVCYLSPKRSITL